VSSVKLRALIAGLIGLAGSFATARVASAQEAALPPELLLHVAAEDAAVTVLDERLRARLGALGVTLSLRPEPTVNVAAVLDESAAGARPSCEGAPLAEAWLDGVVPGEATLVLMPCGADSVLARRLAAPDGFDDVLLAELELIVDRAAQALLAAKPVGGSREAARAALDDAPPPKALFEAPPEAVRRPPRAPTAEPIAVASQLGFAAGVQGWSGDNPALPAGLLFGGLERVSGGARIGLALSIGARGAARVSTTQADLSIWGGDVHLWLDVGRALQGAGLWRLSVGPGMDLSHVTSSRAPGTPATAKATSRTDLDVTIGAQLRWDVVAIGHAHVFAAAAVDVLPRVARYTAIVDDESQTIAQPWRVRPSLMLGVAFEPAAP
jgi:hypothetical protein